MVAGPDPSRMAPEARVAEIARILARAALKLPQKPEVSLAGLGGSERPWGQPGPVKAVAPESTR